MVGKHPVESRCRQQTATSLSSAEAETYAVVTATCEALGLQALFRDLGKEYKVETYVDATATFGAIQRSGSGR